MRLLRKTGAVIGISGVGLGGYVAYRFQYDEGFRRAIRLYSEVGPVVAHYRLLQAKHKWEKYLPEKFQTTQEEKNDAWLSLDKRYSPHVVDLLKDLKGMYTKYGQIGASLTNQLSREWTDKLRELEDAVPPQPAEIVLKTIREETCKDPKETFSYFEEEPLGSASIGQVHRAKLVGSDKFVAVKVQYPSSLKLFSEDMRTIRTFLQVAAPEQVVILDELERSFQREFDYTQEAENLRFFSKALTPFKHQVKVPEPIFASRRMLVMEYLPGIKLLDGIREYGEQIAQKQGRTLDELEAEVKDRILNEGMPAKYEGPSEWQVSVYLNAMYFYDGIRNLGIGILNFLGAPFMKGDFAYYKTILPPNAPRIMDVLMKVHGYQLCTLGRFQADPHAGNFLLLDDGRIGLIDMGAVKELTRGERLAACLLYASLARHDKHMLLDMVRVSGYKSKCFDEDVIWDLCRFGFDTFGRDLLKGKNIQTFMDDLYRRDPWYESATNLTMAQFLSIRLRAVGIAMNFPVECHVWWGEDGERGLNEAGLPYEVWNQEMMNEQFEPPTISQGAITTKLFS